MSHYLKVLSLNIQRANHLHLVLPFLAAHVPDVACIQELYEADVPKISKSLGDAPCIFAPMSRFVREETPQIFGVGIFTKRAVVESVVSFYRGDPSLVPDLHEDDPATWNNKNFPLVWSDIEKEGKIFRIATTHFRWTPDGKVDDAQRRDIVELLRVLDPLGDLVLLGDFNAPRGGEIFEILAHRYIDNVPSQYLSSLDPERHRTQGLQLMVDGLFSTPLYSVSDVEMIPGVSDHCALLANVSKTG